MILACILSALSYATKYLLAVDVSVSILWNIRIFCSYHFFVCFQRFFMDIFDEDLNRLERLKHRFEFMEQTDLYNFSKVSRTPISRNFYI